MSGGRSAVSREVLGARRRGDNGGERVVIYFPAIYRDTILFERIRGREIRAGAVKNFNSGAKKIDRRKHGSWAARPRML